MYQATNVYHICAFAAIGGGLFGFDISSMSGVMGTQAYANYFGYPVSYVQGGITSAMPAGSLVGALCSSYLADQYSRKIAIQFASLLWILGSIIQCLSNGVPMLVVGRAVSGVCIGIASSICPVYQSEIAPKEIRGRVVALQQWAITWGILIQYLIQYAAAQIDGGPNNPNQSTAAFRIPWAIQIIPALILFCGLFFLPKSPRWLAMHDRWDEAIEVMAALHGGGDVDHPKVLAEYQEIEEALRLERMNTSSGYVALLQPRMLRRVVLGMSIQMWAQLSGINIMMYYIVYIMQAANIGSPIVTALVQYVINVLFTLPAVIYLDKWGRRPLFLIGSLLQMTFLFISGSLQATYGQPNDGPVQDAENAAITWIVIGHRKASIAIVACAYLFVASFATTWGPTAWTYPAEIFPSEIRAKAVSITTASNWFWNCILAFAVPPLLYVINWKTYIIFGLCNGMAFIHMFIAAPETKGRSLEEMDEVFDTNQPAWRSLSQSHGIRLTRFGNLPKELESSNSTRSRGNST